MLSKRYVVRLFIALSFTLGAAGVVSAEQLIGNFTGTVGFPAPGRCASTISITGPGTVNVMGPAQIVENHCLVPGSPLLFVDGRFTIISTGSPQDTLFGTYSGTLAPTADPAVFTYSSSPWQITGGTGKFAGAQGFGFGSGTVNVVTRAYTASMVGRITINVSTQRTYFCAGEAQPPDSGIVAIATGFDVDNRCGFNSATFYFEQFTDGLVVCEASAVSAGYILHPLDYRVSEVVPNSRCPSGNGWRINRLTRENRVCTLTNVLGTQLVAAPGYIVKSIQPPDNTCPGPVVTISIPRSGDIACNPTNQVVLANAPYTIPSTFAVLGPAFSATCPSGDGLLLFRP